MPQLIHLRERVLHQQDSSNDDKESQSNEQQPKVCSVLGSDKGYRPWLHHSDAKE